MAEGNEENSKPTNEFFYTWRIENLHLLRNVQNWRLKIPTGEKLKSPIFEVDWLPNISFSLVLYPEGTKGDEDCIGYFLAREDQVYTPNKFDTEFYLLALDGERVPPESTHGYLSMKKFGMVGCPRFMCWETLMKQESYYFPDEILTVGCRLSCKVKQNTKGSTPTEVKVCWDQIFARTQIKKEVIAKQMVIDSIAPAEQKVGEIKMISQEHPIATFFATLDKISGEESLIIDIDIKKDDRIKLAILKLMLIDDKRTRIFWMGTYSWNELSECERIELSPHLPPYSEFYAPDEMFVEKFLFLVCQFTFNTGLILQRQEKRDYGANLKHWLPVYFPSCPPSYEKPMPCPTVKDSLGHMYHDNLFHDVKIGNDSLNITAHKIVLCSRSSKFDALVKSQMKDSDVIQVEDNIDIMEKVVYFLYSDEIPGINWEIATTLYSAGMKYEIGLLKHKCCKFIKDHLDRSKVAEILLLAKEHSDTELMALARNFITKNRTEVFGSDEWHTFSKSHPQLAVEIMMSKFQ